MANNTRQGRAPREFFTLGEHNDGVRHYRFRFDGRVYQIWARRGEQEEEKLMEESDSRTAYDAWNRVKRPERFGGMPANT